MATHATMPTRGRTHARTPARRPRSALAWALPLTLGVIFGFWAFFIRRDGGETTGGQIWLGVATGVALAVLCYVLGRVRHALPRELRAAAFGALTAILIGFLYSLNDHSVLSSTIIGLVVGAGMFCTAFYIYYTRED